jgi:hypothetical protein
VPNVRLQYVGIFALDCEAKNIGAEALANVHKCTEAVYSREIVETSTAPRG